MWQKWKSWRPLKRSRMFFSVQINFKTVRRQISFAECNLKCFHTDRTIWRILLTYFSAARLWSLATETESRNWWRLTIPTQRKSEETPLKTNRSSPCFLPDVLTERGNGEFGKRGEQNGTAVVFSWKVSILLAFQILGVYLFDVRRYFSLVFI